MPSSGGVIVTPVASTGIPIDDNALPYTHLSLNAYARIMQIDPAHFNGLVSSSIFPLDNKCSDIWPRYDWQAGDSVSWESLALGIKEAEDDIKAYMRYSVAPDWEVSDPRPWPKYHRRDSYALGRDMLGEPVGINTSYDYLISPGRRAVSSILTGAVVAYSDPDGDGFNELATISASTSLTDSKEIKVYFADKGGAREWEVRPIKTKLISGGIVTITINAWQLVRPELRELPPTSDGLQAIELLDTTRYVTTLDIYREYTDTTATSAEMFWTSSCGYCGGSGCANCSLASETGCAKIISIKPGYMQAQPASYDSATGSWNVTAWSSALDPVMVNLSYKAGFQSNDYLAGRAYDPLDRSLAKAVAYMATARLERPFCGCGTASSLAKRLMVDMAITDGDTSKTVDFDELANPFGTRVGEIWAYRRLKKLAGKNLGGYAA